MAGAAGLGALAQLGYPTVVAQLHRGHRHGLQFVDVIELGMAAPGLRNDALDAGHITSRQIGIGLHQNLTIRSAKSEAGDAATAAGGQARARPIRNILIVNLADAVT